MTDSSPGPSMCFSLLSFLRVGEHLPGPVFSTLSLVLRVLPVKRCSPTLSLVLRVRVLCGKSLHMTLLGFGAL